MVNAEKQSSAASPPADNNGSTNSRLLDLLQRPENRICCDCSRPRPSWVSLMSIVSATTATTTEGTSNTSTTAKTIGVFCCILCSGVHRSLGTHICFVRSVHLDQWREEDITALEESGNLLVNEILEANLYHKIAPKEDMERRKQFITEKYVEQRYTESNRTKLQYQPPKILSQRNLQELQGMKSRNNDVDDNDMEDSTCNIENRNLASAVSGAVSVEPTAPWGPSAVANVTLPRRSSTTTIYRTETKPETRRLSMPSSPLDGWMRDVNDLFSASSDQKRKKEQAERLAQTLKQKGAICSDDDDDDELDLKRHFEEFRSSQVIGGQSIPVRSQSPPTSRGSSMTGLNAVGSNQNESVDDDLNGELRVLRKGAIRPITPRSIIYQSPPPTPDDTLTDEFLKFRSSSGRGSQTSIPLGTNSECAPPADNNDSSSTWRSWLPTGTSTSNSTSAS